MSTHKLTEEQKARKRLREKERRERMKAEKAKKAAPPKKEPKAGTPAAEPAKDDDAERKANDVAKAIEKLGGVDVLDHLVLSYAGARLYKETRKAIQCAVAKTMERFIDSTGFIVSTKEKNAEIAATCASEALTRAVKDFAEGFKVEHIKACLSCAGK